MPSGTLNGDFVRIANLTQFITFQDKANTEEEFLALRRLVATRAGFAAFTNLAGFREKLGLKVVRALQRDRDHVTQAAIDVLCALMEPMYDESDLRQEQLNKSSLLSSSKFLEGIETLSYIIYFSLRSFIHGYLYRYFRTMDTARVTGNWGVSGHICSRLPDICALRPLQRNNRRSPFRCFIGHDRETWQRAVPSFTTPITLSC